MQGASRVLQGNLQYSITPHTSGCDWGEGEGEMGVMSHRPVNQHVQHGRYVTWQQ